MIRNYSRDPLAPGQKIEISDQWISEATYLEMVRKSMIPCVDTVFTKAGDKALYLAHRIAYPMSGIWLLGGRIFFNDQTLEEAMSRIVERETGLKLDPERFNYISTNYYAWVKLAQGNFPGKNLAVTFNCEVTEEELKKMARGLDPKEYEPGFGLQRFDQERLMKEKVHPALLDIFKQIF